MRYKKKLADQYQAWFPSYNESKKRIFPRRRANLVAPTVLYYFVMYRHDFVETNGDNFALAIPLLSYLTHLMLTSDKDQVWFGMNFIQFG